jgi:hypothetical protein
METHQSSTACLCNPFGIFFGSWKGTFPGRNTRELLENPKLEPGSAARSCPRTLSGTFLNCYPKFPRRNLPRTLSNPPRDKERCGMLRTLSDGMKLRSQTSDLWTDAATTESAVREEKDAQEKESIERISRRAKR